MTIQMQTQMSPKVITVVGADIEQVKKKMSEKQRKRIYTIASPMFLLLIWEALVRLNILNPLFFPAPTTIIGSTIEALTTGQIFSDLMSSMIRVLLGLIVGTIPGIVIGLSMGLFAPVRAIFEPIVAILFPIPKLALMPLVMLAFGLGETEKVVVIMLGVVFPVIINTVAGVMNLESRYMDVAKNFGASKIQYYKTVAFPGSLAMIFTGLKLAVGMALLLIVAAEMHGATSGIGYRIWTSYNLFDINTMFVSFGIMALLGYIATVLLDEIENRVIPWKHK